MDATKIRLSPEEAALVLRGDWILTKNSAIQKIIQMFGIVQAEQKSFLEKFENIVPPELLQSSPKISRGENYLGLPWLMLDYPRLFSKDDSFAIRTFFWWGNFFSVTLQVSGTYKKRYEDQLTSSIDQLKTAGFYACISKDPWQHHFGSDNYHPLDQFDPVTWKELITRGDFLKISKKISLLEWNDAPKKMIESFRELLHALAG